MTATLALLRLVAVSARSPFRHRRLIDTASGGGIQVEETFSTGQGQPDGAVKWTEPLMINLTGVDPGPF
jgi:hypothetical protein